MALNLASLPIAPWPTPLARFARKALVACTFPTARALSVAAARARSEALDLAVPPVPALPASTAIGPNVSLFTSARLPITHASTVRRATAGVLACRLAIVPAQAHCAVGTIFPNEPCLALTCTRSCDPALFACDVFHNNLAVRANQPVVAELAKRPVEARVALALAPFPTRAPPPASFKLVARNRAAFPVQIAIALPAFDTSEALPTLASTVRLAGTVEAGTPITFLHAILSKPPRRALHTSRPSVSIRAGTGAAECLVDTYARALPPTMARAHARLVFTRHVAILSEEARGALVAIVALEPEVTLAAPILQAVPMC